MVFCVHHALADDGLGEDGQRRRCLVGVDYGLCRHGFGVVEFIWFEDIVLG